MTIHLEIHAPAKLTFSDDIPVMSALDHTADDRLARTIVDEGHDRLVLHQPRRDGITDAQPRVSRDANRPLLARCSPKRKPTAVVLHDHADCSRARRRDL